MRRFQFRRFSLIVLVFLLLTGAVASAQGGTPLAIGENKAGAVDVAGAAAPFSISVAAPQSVNIQVLAITQGFSPTFRVLDPNGLVVLDVPPSSIGTTAQGSPSLSSSGSYTVEVRGANNSTGQFLISLQPGAPLLPPEALTLGQAVNGTVDGQTTRRAYSFSGSEEEAFLLTVRSDQPTVGEVIALRDAETGEMLGMITASLSGAQFRIMPALRGYVLEVMHGGGIVGSSYVVCLATESGSINCPGFGAQFAPTGVEPTEIVPTAAEPTVVVPTPLATATLIPTSVAPTINPAGACSVVTRGQFVNVRSGPGTGFSVLTQLSPSGVAPVIGRLPDNTWWQVQVNGIIGWVSAAVVTLGGNCAGVSVVVPPTVIPPAETAEVTPGTPTTTLTPSNTPTATVTVTPSNTPTATPTFSGTLVFPVLTFRAPIGTLVFQPINQELDYSASPAYGQANLSNGFTPDPYSVGMTGGGSVNVSYLGGSCAGFASVAPSLRVNYGGGGGSLLRLYFVGSADSTMVINDPYGNFYCVDDSFGTVNPTIDFNNPAGGSYDIWVASYNSGSVSGTLYVTQNSGNHP
jgi:hypothetical protein